MEFDLNEFLDIIESDKKYWCEEKMKSVCSADCKYFSCICSTAEYDIENVRKLASVCFHSNYEEE